MGNEVRVYADRAYDSSDIFNLLRNNFSTLSRGSPLRGKTARAIRNMEEDHWKRVHEYVKRWTMEIYFSGLRRFMGEIIRIRKPEYVIQEAGLKVLYYNMMRENDSLRELCDNVR